MSTNDTAEDGLRFDWTTAAFGAGALLTIVLGYWLLGQGSISLAPVLLVIGYVVLVPLALLR